MKATVRSDNPYPVPAGEPLPAELVAVEEVHREGTTEQGREYRLRRWVWTFKVTGGAFLDMHLTGETDPEITDATVPKSNRVSLAKPWAEGLLGRLLAVGEELDTDDLHGLPCVITCRHDAPRRRRDGGQFYPCPVVTVQHPEEPVEPNPNPLPEVEGSAVPVAAEPGPAAKARAALRGARDPERDAAMFAARGAVGDLLGRDATWADLAADYLARVGTGLDSTVTTEMITGYVTALLDELEARESTQDPFGYGEAGGAT